MAAAVLGAIVRAVNLVQAAVVTAFLALGVRAVLLVLMDRRRSLGVTVVRLGAAGLFLAAGVVYASLVAPAVVWDAWATAAAIVTALLALSGVAVRRAPGWAERGRARPDS
ncbi:MAG: hypothetical protein HY359_13055 [Candidatus Rokubacteria bacterium]|nr:hypothetical protein [Candidatus Rokubacteria bacterium]